MNEQEFFNSVRKIKEPRKHKIKNSYGVYDGYKYYRKNKPEGSQYVLSESQYFAIIRRINKLLVEQLLTGYDIILPSRMGRIELRKSKPSITFDGNKLKANLPIDWDKTLKLWYEDEEAYKNKTLVKIEEREVYKIYYNRGLAEYTNKSFYQFNFNRDLKRRLKTNIKEGVIDAFNF